MKKIDDKHLACLNSFAPNATSIQDWFQYCNISFDKVLCWPVTRANTTAQLNCPAMRGTDPSKFAYRTCQEGGKWSEKTNYDGCYDERYLNLVRKLFASDSKTLKEIAYGVRILELVGSGVSFLSLALSIYIFCSFSRLRCDRTRIHRNLFVAIFIHVTLLLVVHIDQLVTRAFGTSVAGSTVNTAGTIHSTYLLCEITVAMKEYTKTVMFMWMFIEGVHLYKMLVASVFSGKPNYILYYIIGWGIPINLTVCWGLVDGLLVAKQNCFFGYTFRSYYWILEGPRAAVIVVNFTILIVIVCVLITKMRNSNSVETVQVRKAVKAAIVLLPLLGINNFLVMVEIPTDNVVQFAVFTIIAHGLSSFQGFFIALLYCFLNGEVQSALWQSWQQNRYSIVQHRNGTRRFSGSVTMFTSVVKPPPQQTRLYDFNATTIKGKPARLAANEPSDHASLLARKDQCIAL